MAALSLRARLVSSICALFVLYPIGAVSSAQAPSAPTFEVASVKANKSGDARTDGRLAGGRFSMINETVWRLIGEAYATAQALPRFRIIGAPDWVDTERFDVEGVAPGSLTRDQARMMLRTLLAERFKLVAHTETRELPVYALVLSRKDGTLGPQLRRSETDCAAPRAERGAQPPPASNRPAPCVMGFGFGRLTATGMTMVQLADMGLSRYADRTVIDRTGLAGPFDWTVVWTPDNLPKRAPGTAANEPLRVNGFEIDPDGPSLFTALQEQLGLKLESTRGPVDVLVIDHLDHPTAN